MILVRATKLTEPVAALAEHLGAETGLEVGFLLDGRHPVELSTTRAIVPLTQPALEALGVFCPPDYPWRCGDYGLYLARRQLPDAPRFWLFEHDVRWSGEGLGDFFRRLEARPEIDFLTTHLRPAERDWAWRGHGVGRGVTPWACFFPLIRVSAAAIDAMLAKRVAQSGSSQRRKAWPNDESFTATTLVNGGFDCHDLNEFGRVYEPDTFNWVTRLRGEELPPVTEGLRFFHPVLFGEDFERGNLSRRDGPPKLRPKAALRRALNVFHPW